MFMSQLDADAEHLAARPPVHVVLGLCTHAALEHRHVQKGWRGGGVQRDGARAVCMWAETTRLLEVMIT